MQWSLSVCLAANLWLCKVIGEVEAAVLCKYLYRSSLLQSSVYSLWFWFGLLDRVFGEEEDERRRM